MTTFETLVSISQTALRARGEWHGPATAHGDMDWVVNRVAEILPDQTRELSEMAIAELKRRAGYRAD
jgi:hypothetical protein